MSRGYNTKSKGLMPLDGPELNPAYGPWVSVEECTAFWTETNGLAAVPEGATCAVKQSDGKIVKYHYENGTWVVESPETLGEEKTKELVADIFGADFADPDNTVDPVPGSVNTSILPQSMIDGLFDDNTKQ